MPALPLTFLWEGRLARGKLAILDGDPGLGKSLVTLDLAARVTTGRRGPTTPRPARRVTCVIVNCEDGAGDTIRPRLEALGADLDRVYVLRGRKVNGDRVAPDVPARPAARWRGVVRDSGGQAGGHRPDHGVPRRDDLHRQRPERAAGAVAAGGRWRRRPAARSCWCGT